MINQIGATNESLEQLNDNLIKVMTILEGNSNKIEKLTDDLTNLKTNMQGNIDDIQILRENMVEMKEKVPDEDMTSLVQELKSCIKSNRSIDKDNSAIKEKLNKVYGKNFLNR